MGNKYLAIFLGSLGGIVGIIAVVCPEKLLELTIPFIDAVTPFIFAIIGAVLLVPDFFWIYKTKKFVGRCLKTKGVVVDLSWFSQQVDAEGSPIYPHDFGKTPSGEEKYASPVVQFVDPRSGRKITVGSSWGGSPPAYHIGEEVAVLYDPENPSNAKIKSFWEIWGTVLSLTILSGMFLSVGLIVAYIIS